MTRHQASAVRLICIAAAVVTLTCALADRPAQYRYTGTPDAPQYSFPVQLDNLNNATQISHLTPEQKAMLRQQGFVVIPDDAEQMFYMYEDYPDWELGYDKPTPNFITVDSILQAYHLFFDYSLRSVEREYLVDACIELTKICAFHNDKFSTQCSGELHEAARDNVVFFSIAWSLATGQEQVQFLQGDERQLFNAEMALIDAMGGRDKSPLMGTTIHYDQFRPRGHYTRHEELKDYFRAMMWLGRVGFELDEGPPEITETVVRSHQRQALLITKILLGDDRARRLWARIYEPTDFFVGGSDDLGFREYETIARDVFGPRMQLSTLADEQKLSSFIQRARDEFEQAGIRPFFIAAGERDPKLQGRQFRVMGQRFIPDSYMLQNLVSPKVQPVPGTDDARDVPMGLDVMSVLGSARAYRHLIELYDQGRFPKYEEQMSKLRQEFAAYPESKWWSNLYWGWIYSLEALLEEWGGGYPSFMQQVAWQDKELNTSLASWAQLRHDTILYAKPSGAEMGAAAPEYVRGYVEPVPEAWGRLAYLAKLARDGLQARGLLHQDMADAYAGFGGMLQFLKACSEKELAGEALTRDEYERIQYFGGELERLQLSVVQSQYEDLRVDNWFSIESDVERNIATVADVHTSFSQCLEEAVGYAYRIYVVVPDPYGGLAVTKGGVFSYYEFLWPVSDRLTDEKWLEMLKNDRQPDRPEWTESFIQP
ncbi:MAG: DUF3160 domain-containing protein [Armatimonadota bacterium]